MEVAPKLSVDKTGLAQVYRKLFRLDFQPVPRRKGDPSESLRLSEEENTFFETAI